MKRMEGGGSEGKEQLQIANDAHFQEFMVGGGLQIELGFLYILFALPCYINVWQKQFSGPE